MIASGTVTERCPHCNASVNYFPMDETVTKHVCPRDNVMGYWFIKTTRDRIPPLGEQKKQKKQRPRDGRYGPSWGFAR